MLPIRTRTPTTITKEADIDIGIMDMVGGLEVQLPDRCVLMDMKTTCPGTGRSREGEGGGWVAAGLLPHCTAD